MGPVDVVILVAVLALVALAIRSVVRSGGDCSSCGSRGSCSAHASGGTCTAAQRMLRDAERALGKRG
ncbi:MAG TPA: FeoB-associated Cys-rich membrane protein [Candidatus Olsenella avicola]|nr:FeoB-associated Cys-rich membrane protein [Candidatus Olsenella avicola]